MITNGSPLGGSTKHIFLIFSKTRLTVHTDTRNVAYMAFKGMKHTKHIFSGIIGYIRHFDHFWFTFRGFHKHIFFGFFSKTRFAVHAVAKNVMMLIIYSSQYKIDHISGIKGLLQNFQVLIDYHHRDR